MFMSPLLLFSIGWWCLCIGRTLSQQCEFSNEPAVDVFFCDDFSRPFPPSSSCCCGNASVCYCAGICHCQNASTCECSGATRCYAEDSQLVRCDPDCVDCVDGTQETFPPPSGNACSWNTPAPASSWGWPTPAPQYSYSGESSSSSGGTSPVLVAFLVFLGFTVLGVLLCKVGLCDRSRVSHPYRRVAQKPEPLRPPASQVFKPNYYQALPSAPLPPPPRYGEENSPPKQQSILIPGEQAYYLPPPAS
eukprot:TRINITY_DN28049_c0_g2_i1.p1 TRINITY_DN28049_c0_g2~~TRINITY_DN28049_c0_g2_i1.p1  ORF type:complete len:248 (-),score=36.88 TRINITY_DN28049_c0_g2_i1:400-1143(-)